MHYILKTKWYVIKLFNQNTVTDSMVTHSLTLKYRNNTVEWVRVNADTVVFFKLCGVNTRSIKTGLKSIIPPNESVCLSRVKGVSAKLSTKVTWLT